MRVRVLEPPDPLAPSAGEDTGLPEGWTWTTIGQACQLNSPKPSPDALPADELVTFVPMPAVDTDSGTIASAQERTFGEVRKGYTAFRDDDVIMAKITPFMENGKAAIARSLTNGLGFGSTEFHILRPSGIAIPEYLFYYVRQESFRTAAEAEMTGSVGQRRVPATFLDGAPIPLPPLAEQRRIVEKLEALLAQVDASRTRLAIVPTILKRFRQAVLAAACSGHLTADWRDASAAMGSAAELMSRSQDQRCQRFGRLIAPAAGRRRTARAVDETSANGLDASELPELPAGWAWYSCADLCMPERSLTYGVIKLGPPVEDGVPILRSSDVRHLFIDESSVKRISGNIASEYQRTVLLGGEVVVTVRGSLGGVAVVPSHMKCYNVSREVAVVPLESSLSPSYIAYAIGSVPRQNWLAGVAKGVAYTGVNIEDLKLLPIPLPPAAEQHEIVRRVEALFKLADAIERRVAQAAVRADRLTQAVLARAFRGELVPTEAKLGRRERRDYEPASALLKRIGQEGAERP